MPKYQMKNSEKLFKESLANSKKSIK